MSTELRRCRHGGTWEPYGEGALKCSKCGDVDILADPDDYPTNEAEDMTTPLPDQPQPAATETAITLHLNLTDFGRILDAIWERYAGKHPSVNPDSRKQYAEMYERLGSIAAAPPSGQVVVDRALVADAADYIVPRGVQGHRIRNELRAALTEGATV